MSLLVTFNVMQGIKPATLPTGSARNGPTENESTQWRQAAAGASSLGCFSGPPAPNSQRPIQAEPRKRGREAVTNQR